MCRQLIYLLDKIGKVKDGPSGIEFLGRVEKAYKIQNISYLCVNLPKPNRGDCYLLHTYGSDWDQWYVEADISKNDPTVKAGLGSVVPVDWADLKPLCDEHKAFFRDGQNLGMARQGLTFNIRGANGENAVFSVNSNLNDQDWKKFKTSFMADLQLLATYFHSRIIQTMRDVCEETHQKLSSRELDCLKWCALGKSYWETSVILGISERTVNLHMTSARLKLDAMTNAQAVCKGLLYGLIIL